MNKKMFFIGLFLTAAACSSQAAEEIGSAIKKSNPNSVRLLLAKEDINSEQKELLIQAAEVQSELAALTKDNISLVDAANLTAGSIGLYCSAASSIALLLGTGLAVFNDKSPSLIKCSLMAAGALGAATYGYIGGCHLFNGFTKQSRKQKLINALAIENIMHSITTK